jgi:hypothetical protein
VRGRMGPLFREGLRHRALAAGRPLVVKTWFPNRTKLLSALAGPPSVNQIAALHCSFAASVVGPDSLQTRAGKSVAESFVGLSRRQRRRFGCSLDGSVQVPVTWARLIRRAGQEQDRVAGPEDTAAR